MRKLLLVFLILFTQSLLSKDNDIFDALVDSIRNTSRRDTDSAILLSKQLVDLGKTSNSTYAIVRGSLFLGFFFENQKGSPIKGLIHYLNGFKQYELYPEKEVLPYIKSITKNTAGIYLDIGQTEIALDFYFKTLKYVEGLNDTSELMLIKSLISDTYALKKDKENSYLYIDQTIELMPHLSIEDQYLVLNSAGLTSMDLKDYGLSENYFNELLAHAIKNYDQDTAESLKYQSFSLHNLGMIHYNLGDYTAAIDNLTQSYSIKIEFPELFSSYNKFNSLYDLGKCYHKLDNHTEAVGFFESAEQYVDGFNINSDKERFRIYQLKGESYYALGDFKNATTAQNTYTSYLDQYLNTKEKSAEENQKLNVELITRQYFESVETAQNDTTLFWISIIGIGLVFSIGSSLGYNAFQKNRLKRRLESQIKRIQESS